MEYILLFILLIQFMINYKLVKDIIDPIVMLRIVWIVSTCLLLIFKNIWNVSLSTSTVLIFVVGFIFFDLGFYTLEIMKAKKINKIKQNGNQDFKVRVNKSIIVLLIVSILGTYICYLSYKIVGSFSGLSDFLISLRYTMKRTDINTSFIQFSVRIIECVGIVYFLIYLIDKNKDKRRKMIYLAIIILSLLIMVLSTGRYRFLAILVIWLYLYVLHQRKNGKLLNFGGQFKLVRIGFISVVAFVIFFRTFGGALLGKGDDGVLYNIAIYFSSGMVAFDKTWETLSNTSQYFGAALFSPFYSILDNIFNIRLGSEITGVLPTVYADNGFASNVYTFYRQQIIDFGVIAIPFVMIFLGVLFSFLKMKSNSEERIGFWSVIYSYFIFGIITSSFQDMFFTNSTYNIISILIFFLLLKTPILISRK